MGSSYFVKINWQLIVSDPCLLVIPTLIGAVMSTRRSTSGYVDMMAKGPVSCLSKLQPITTVSSIEAEYGLYFSTHKLEAHDYHPPHNNIYRQSTLD